MGRTTMFLEILVPQAHGGPVGLARNFPRGILAPRSILDIRAMLTEHE